MSEDVGLKEKIENALEMLDLSDAEILIKEYEQIHPKDMDLLSFYCILFLYQGNGEKALEYARLGMKRYPTSADMFYNLASVYEYLGDACNSLKYFFISLFFYQQKKEVNPEFIEGLICKVNELVKIVMEEKEVLQENMEKNIYKLREIDELIGYQDELWGIGSNYFNISDKKIVGTYRWVGNNDKRFIGYIGQQLDNTYKESDYNLSKMKGEFLCVTSGTVYEIEAKGEYILPIAVQQPNTEHEIITDDNVYKILQRNNNHFNYYRMKGKTSIHSNKLSYYGRPIALNHDDKRKKLVLNIFIDGLTQDIFEGNFQSMKELMPNTSLFFEKGVICSNAYTAAEWTYPSLASYVSGLDIIHHMLFHSQYNTVLPDDITLLFEYFSKAGYYTAKVDGDWRSTPYLGYGRGLDRYVYQIQTHGGRIEQEIGAVLEHLITFKETDQFLWICFGDLHDIADELDLSIAIQSELPLSIRDYEERGQTSVKQKYSEQKKAIYKNKLKYIDIYLGILYSYIKSNYVDDEILISLFGDHGQGYLVPEGEHFLSKERSKVAFMFRGGECKEGVCEELVSTTDYTSIMCRLAGIQMEKDVIQGQLPIYFGGEKERDYVTTESLHPGDPYQIAIHTKEYVVYFTNGDLTRDDGRFYLKNYSIYAKTYDGKKIENPEIIEKYLSIILERIAHLIIYDV